MARGCRPLLHRSWSVCGASSRRRWPGRSRVPFAKPKRRPALLEVSRRLRTAEVAARVGVHPNTVHKYESLGFIAAVPRSAAGYREFSGRHLLQLQITRLAIGGPYVVPKRIAARAARQAANGERKAAAASATAFQHLLDDALSEAESAARILDNWAADPSAEELTTSQPISSAAAAVGVSADSLRDWERNGLIAIRRNPGNGYRSYTVRDVERLHVIRVLLRARYSRMSVLRMITALDRGDSRRPSEVLDAPRLDETAIQAADRWRSSLHRARAQANRMIELIRALPQR